MHISRYFFNNLYSVYFSSRDQIICPNLKLLDLSGNKLVQFNLDCLKQILYRHRDVIILLDWHFIQHILLALSCSRGLEEGALTAHRETASGSGDDIQYVFDATRLNLRMYSYCRKITAKLFSVAINSSATDELAVRDT